MKKLLSVLSCMICLVGCASHSRYANSTPIYCGKTVVCASSSSKNCEMEGSNAQYFQYGDSATGIIPATYYLVNVVAKQRSGRNLVSCNYAFNQTSLNYTGLSGVNYLPDLSKGEGWVGTTQSATCEATKNSCGIITQ